MSLTVSVLAISMGLNSSPGSRIPQFSLASVMAGEDTPSGGGYGCKSNGHCQGTVYKDKKQFDAGGI
jgi:hypothetical protein